MFAAALGSSVTGTPTRTSSSNFGNRFDGTTPPTTRDHWHWAYGVYVCNAFVAPLVDDGSDQSGIHTHGEGVIHVHPFESYWSGTNATLQVFFETVGATVSPTNIGLRDSRTGASTSYQTCNGVPAKVMATVWDLDSPAAPPQTTTGDIKGIRFTKDRQAVTVAIVPAGTTPPRPDSIPALDRLTDTPGGFKPGNTTTTAQRPTLGTIDTSDVIDPRSEELSRIATDVLPPFGPAVRLFPYGQTRSFLSSMMMPGTKNPVYGAAVSASASDANRPSPDCNPKVNSSVLEFTDPDDAQKYGGFVLLLSPHKDGTLTSIDGLPADAKATIRKGLNCPTGTVHIVGQTGRYVYQVGFDMQVDADRIEAAALAARLSDVLRRQP